MRSINISSILIFLFLSTALVCTASAADPGAFYTSNTTYVPANYIFSDFWWFITLTAWFCVIASNWVTRNNDFIAAVAIPLAWLSAYWSTAINYIDKFVNVIGNGTEYYTVVYTQYNTIHTPLYLTFILYGFAVLTILNLIKIILENRLPSKSQMIGDEIEKPDFETGEKEMP
jgi:hypothetical protein